MNNSTLYRLLNPKTTNSKPIRKQFNRKQNSSEDQYKSLLEAKSVKHAVARKRYKLNPLDVEESKKRAMYKERERKEERNIVLSRVLVLIL